MCVCVWRNQTSVKKVGSVCLLSHVLELKISHLCSPSYSTFPITGDEMPELSLLVIDLTRGPVFPKKHAFHWRRLHLKSDSSPGFKENFDTDDSKRWCKAESLSNIQKTP